MSEDDRAAERECTFDRHGDEYRVRFEELAADMQARCPVAWNESSGGHWFAAGNKEVFDIARSADKVSNARDLNRGLQGISIPTLRMPGMASSFLEMDPPDQRYYRQTLNPYLSPAAVARWKPVAEEITRAALNEKIATGAIDFVDDLANIVPAVLTLAMMGLPLADWPIYCEPAHAGVYTKPDSPDRPRVMAASEEMRRRLGESLPQAREEDRPGLVQALANCVIDGRTPDDDELSAQLGLIIGGGFDTTTALTAHALEWLSEHPDQRKRLSLERDSLLDSATEEFLRFYTPAPGDGRTVTEDFEVDGVELKAGDRLWLSWAMANRDPSVFPDPNEIILDRSNNRHSSFGLGIHRCIGSNVARMTFKSMITAVLDRMPDFACDPTGAVHYDTVGIINGMKHLPATFTPGPQVGPGLAETLQTLQQICDEQRLAEPVTVRHETARVGPAGT
ncbi:MAG: cytochrome [Frankiales bacterium]|jgi:cytochrome P450|nr:cytochrome [Frankiales bacterium]